MAQSLNELNNRNAATYSEELTFCNYGHGKATPDSNTAKRSDAVDKSDNEKLLFVVVCVPHKFLTRCINFHLILH